MIREYAERRRQHREDMEMFAQSLKRHNYIHSNACNCIMILLLSAQEVTDYATNHTNQRYEKYK